MRLIVSRADEIKVIVYCWEEDGEVQASHLKAEIPEKNIKVVEKVEFSFRKPSYADSNVIIRNSNFRAAENNETSLDVSAFQENILRNLLQEWDMKDEDGNKVSLNTASINSLVPNVARAAVAGVLDRISL